RVSVLRYSPGKKFTWNSWMARLKSFSNFLRRSASSMFFQTRPNVCGIDPGCSCSSARSCIFNKALNMMRKGLHKMYALRFKTFHSCHIHLARLPSLPLTDEQRSYLDYLRYQGSPTRLVCSIIL